MLVSSNLAQKKLRKDTYYFKHALEMKVILEIDYNAAEWTIILLFKTLRRLGIKPKIFKIGRSLPTAKNEEKKSDVYYSIPFIKKVISMTTDMPEDIFESASRQLEIAETRQIAMYLCRKYTRRSLREIGLEFGGKTPATVMHACKTILNLEQTDKKFQTKLNEIENNLIFNNSHK